MCELCSDSIFTGKECGCKGDDEMNSETDYSQKYNSLVKNLKKLIESKTQVTKNLVLYDLIHVSELKLILNGYSKK